MPVTGRKPKPEHERRNRMPPTHQWTDVPNVPNPDPPPIPPHPSEYADTITPPPPSRPLGRIGSEMWQRCYWAITTAADLELLALVCEQMDDRLRLRVPANQGDYRAGVALRQVETMIGVNLNRLSLSADAATTRPAGWPEATREWWDVVSRMPHTVLWDEGDWQFARDTLYLVAAYHAGHVTKEAVVLRREKILGITSDARRDLRIRYVDPENHELLAEDPDTPEELPRVSSLAERRRRLTEGA